MIVKFLFEKMPKYITIKYNTEKELAKEPYQVTENSAVYDVFAAETKMLLPNSVDIISLELRWAIPNGFYGKLFPRSGILRKHFVSIDAGVIDADFGGIIQILMVNHHPQKTFTVRTCDRIAQVVFMKKFNANVSRVTDKHLLGQTKQGNDDFGSTGVTVIKKAKKDDDDEIELTTLENNQVIVTSEENLQIIPERSENEVQITSEEAIMNVNEEVAVYEAIAIDE